MRWGCTVFPPLLAMLDLEASDDEMREATRVLESYLLRRTVCVSDTKAYNRVFMGLTRAIRRDGATAAVVRSHLANLQGATDAWPSDERFSEAWMTGHAYLVLNNARIVYILSKLSDTYRTSKTEQVTVSGQLTVEHLMPQSWIAHWPLQDGSMGVDNPWSVPADDPRALATRARSATVQTFGNLTLITGGLNSSNSNGAWANKRAAIAANSLLPINLQLCIADTWDEGSIERRGRDLLSRALKLWPRG